MKLQIEGQHLRVRIDEAELARLLASETINIRTDFADAFAVSFELRLVDINVATFAGAANAWQIALPLAMVREHADQLPTREGLRFNFPAKNSAHELLLLFDVDVRDSVRRRKSS